jgi:SAM-dependent methyltransferase
LSLSRGYFEELYTTSPDPWGFRIRAYERRKYAITLAALPRERYRRAFEPGCSIGVLTGMLAKRVDVLLASDISPTAIAIAERADLPDNVELAVRTVPQDWPDGSLDLIVVSELGYYFDPDDLNQFIARATNSLNDDGHLIAVHWRTPVPDYPSDAAAVHRRLLASELKPLAHYEDDHFVLDVLGARSAACLIGPEDESGTNDERA